jgi:hypothetical protein
MRRLPKSLTVARRPEKMLDRRMYRIFLIACLLALPGVAHADCTLYVPKNCAYKGSSLSTSGEKSPGYVVEYDCQKPDGQIVKYMDWNFSVLKYFGVGRFSVPRKTIFREWDKDSIELSC